MEGPMIKRADGGILAAVVSMALSLTAMGDSQPIAPENLIRVEIAGARSDHGQVLCALFTSGSGFPTRPEGAVGHTQSAITQGSAVCEFHNIAPGRYAISVFHDEN